jgi:hypothetical protein
MKRRDILAGFGGSVVVVRSAQAVDQSVWLSPQMPAGTREVAKLEALPGKQPLIRLADRPPNYEAPISRTAGHTSPRRTAE